MKPIPLSSHEAGRVILYRTTDLSALGVNDGGFTWGQGENQGLRVISSVVPTPSALGIGTLITRRRRRA